MSLSPTMKLLMLAPQPFYQERGTPIAVRLALEVLEKRRPMLLSLLTYGEGSPIDLGEIHHYRSHVPRLAAKIPPGISWKKLIADTFFAWKALVMMYQQRDQQFDLVHAVEESVFIAYLGKKLFGIPYLYDMDSSLSLQLSESWRFASPFVPVLRWLEKIVVRNALAVVPVCDALATIATRHGAKDLEILHDISLLDFDQSEREEISQESLRTSLQIPKEMVLALYVGNLEKYQGIDLLVEALAAKPLNGKGKVVVVGGRTEHVEHYQRKAVQLSVQEQIVFAGPRPVQQLPSLLEEADILLSPRIQGNNTPMKIYSYLHSGKAIVATCLKTHTQVLTDDVSALAEPTPECFGEALHRLVHDNEFRETLGAKARKLAEENYTYEVFERRLNELYDRLPLGQNEQATTCPQLSGTSE